MKYKWKFETYVEKIKFDVLREVARACYAGNFKEIESKLPEILIPGRKANYRCCWCIRTYTWKRETNCWVNL